MLNEFNLLPPPIPKKGSLQFDYAQHWVPGDICAIWPVVDPALVTRFLELQELSPDAMVVMQCLRKEEPLIPPTPITLRTLFTYYLDITALPKGRWFFQVIAQFTSDEVRRDKLVEFGGRSLEAKDALFEYCKRPRRSILDMFEDFHTTKVPLNILVNIVPPMRARQYSIANACITPSQSPYSNWLRTYRRTFHACWDVLSLRDRGAPVELCVAIVDFERGARHIEGTCSSYLRAIKKGDRIRARIEKGTMNLATITKPLICICPGTGLTPVRALLQERSHEEDLIFLGFRNKSQDFLYEDEWPRFKSTVHTAFSRDDPEKKIYVQDVIEEQGDAVTRALDNGAVIFISGRSHPMPQQVRSSLLEVIQKCKNVSEVEAEAYLTTLKKEQRYITDTWG
eukprot:GEMP01024879.1.p1 GENE.GEMP01024879.1~~GEMP01024879.1.p1  ORF type:complete len:397 (+),score=79.19 GEMP01024879.1:688-1878(+)